jgi:hypothetical protein
LGQQPNSLPSLFSGAAQQGPAQLPPCISYLRSVSSSVAAPPSSLAPRCSPPTVPGYKKVAAALGTLALISPSPSPCSPPSNLQAPPWPPASAAVPRHPSLHRRAEKLRLVLLLFLAEGIEPGRLESPTPSPIPPQRTAAAAVDYAAVSAPSAKLTLPVTSW